MSETLVSQEGYDHLAKEFMERLTVKYIFDVFKDMGDDASARHKLSPSVMDVLVGDNGIIACGHYSSKTGCTAVEFIDGEQAVKLVAGHDGQEPQIMLAKNPDDAGHARESFYGIERNYTTIDPSSMDMVERLVEQVATAL